VELAEQLNRLSGGTNAPVLGTLAAASAEAGQVSAAVATAEEALRLATSQNNTALVKALHAQIERYRAGAPFRDNSLAGARTKGVE
jgi:hypothetical protein